MAGSLTVRELITKWVFDVEAQDVDKLDRRIDKLQKTVKRAQVGLKKFGAGIGRVLKRAALVGAGAIAGIGIASIKAASDAEESESKFDAVFKTLKGDVREWSNVFAESIGRNEFEIRGFLAGLQDTFVPLGFARDKAADLSKSLTTLAIDVASFQNKSEPEVIKAFTSAMVGNHEAVRAFGITLSQAKLDQKIKSMKKEVAGFNKIGKEQQKVMARYKLIMEGSTDAMGDAKRTAGSFANQMKNLKAQATKVMILIGNQLIPHLKPLIARMIDWIKNNQKLIKQKIPEIVNKIVEAVKFLAKIMMWVIDNGKTLLAVLAGLAAFKILSGIGALISGVAALGDGLIAVATAGAKAKAAAAGVGAIAPAAGAATGAISALLGKLGLLAAAGAVGFGIGTLLDKWLDLSGKISTVLVGPERKLAEMRAQVYGQLDGWKRLVEQAQIFQNLSKRGVKSIRVEGGEQLELTQENIQARLQQMAQKFGLGQQFQQQIPTLARAGAGPPGAAKGGDRTVNVQAPVTVNAPPGTPETLAKRVGGAAADAATKVYRQALGDIAR